MASHHHSLPPKPDAIGHLCAAEPGSVDKHPTQLRTSEIRTGIPSKFPYRQRRTLRTLPGDQPAFPRSRPLTLLVLLRHQILRECLERFALSRTLARTLNKSVRFSPAQQARSRRGRLLPWPDPAITRTGPANGTRIVLWTAHRRADVRQDVPSPDLRRVQQSCR